MRLCGITSSVPGLFHLTRSSHSSMSPQMTELHPSFYDWIIFSCTGNFSVDSGWCQEEHVFFPLEHCLFQTEEPWLHFTCFGKGMWSPKSSQMLPPLAPPRPPSPRHLLLHAGAQSLGLLSTRQPLYHNNPVLHFWWLKCLLWVMF